jgi:hypothetical protein
MRLLAAPGAGFTDRDFNEVQPLTYRRVDPTTCIDHWTLIRPPETIESGSPDDSAVAGPTVPKTVRPWLGNPVTTIAGIHDFFADRSAPLTQGSSVTPSSNAEGVILLAHHGDNGISLDSESNIFQVSDIRRRFPAGSAAILAACSVTNPIANDGLVTRLNQRHFDAVVASPFPVDTAYAEGLVQRFLGVLDDAYARNEQLTIQQIFQRAVASAAPDTAPEDPDRAAYSQEGLEFVIAGDPSLRLCGKPQERKP